MEQPVKKKWLRDGLTILSVLIVSTIILGMIGCSGNSVTPREGSLSGKITNVSGKPVEDALVSWTYDRTRWCLTDEKGAYYINGVGFGDQNFQVETFGFRTASFKVAIFSGQNTAAGDVKIEAKSFDFLDIKIDEVSATHAVISWKTTDYTNGLIEYGETESTGRVVREETGVYATTHSVKVTGLTSAKTYYFKVVANREGRTAETSSLQRLNTLSTNEDKTPPNPPAGVEAALTGTPGQLAVFWAASSDTDLKGYRVYRSELANGVFSPIGNMLIAKGQEKFTDYTVVAGRTYYYRVTALDQAGNESGFNNMAYMMVPGNIATEVRWTRANSPYIVAGDITVSETGKLYIDSGVEILIAESDGLRSGNPNMIEFNISGAMIASAGNGLPVIFASARVNPDKAMWQGLVFENSADGSSTLINVSISDAVNGLHINKSTGQFSQIFVSNSNTGVVCENTAGVSIDKVTTKRCTTGMELKNNSSLMVSGCSLVHPTTGINSQSNDGIKIIACNFLEYTETGLVSNEVGGIIEFIDNLFVSPVGTGIKILQQSVLVEYNTFDTPYGIQISTGNSTVKKNLIMADRSIFAGGKKGIEYLAPTLPLVKFGPNNMQDFASGSAYIGCDITSDSKSDDVLLMKELTGDLYDYRLRQAYPDLSDPWGIRRDAIPFEN